MYVSAFTMEIMILPNMQRAVLVVSEAATVVATSVGALSKTGEHYEKKELTCS